MHVAYQFDISTDIPIPQNNQNMLRLQHALCSITAQLKGEVPEWSNGLVLKTSVPKGTVGSNPTLTAIFRTIPFGVLFEISRSGIRKTDPPKAESRGREHLVFCEASRQDS